MVLFGLRLLGMRATILIMNITDCELGQVGYTAPSGRRFANGERRIFSLPAPGLRVYIGSNVIGIPIPESATTKPIRASFRCLNGT